VRDLRLDTNFIDYAILAAYFAVVLGVGFAAKRYIRSSLDYFLSGRSLPAWITGLAFISANLGALEVIGMSANGAAGCRRRSTTRSSSSSSSWPS
jgi:SSS family solute:Na+ symporter